MIVGGRERHQLADTEFGDLLVARALELGRILHRTRTDDGSLVLHQARHGVHGADGARVGQRNGHARKVFRGELAVARTAHDVLVRRVELGETHCLAVLDGGDDERAVAILTDEVDRQTEVGVRRGDHIRLAVDLGEVAVHVRERLDRLDDRVAEDVGEADLAAAGAGQMIVDDDAVVDHQLGRDRTNGRGGRDLQRRRHVLGNGGRGAA